MVSAAFIIFVILSILVWSSQSSEIQTNDAQFLRKQELIFQLLWNTKEPPKNHPEVFERVKNFKIEDVSAACENQTYAKKFEAHLRHGSLPRGQVFSIFRDEHVDEVKTLFDVFFNAKSFDDFMAMAAWSSLVVNEMSWLHAFSIALAHRSDTKYLRLPNIYEIVPQYFFNADIIIQSYRVKSREIAVAGDEYVIEANYSGQLPSQDWADDEYKLSYFTEDVDLNEFYFHFINNHPFWMKSRDSSLRGELYYYVHKTLFSKYKLERLSVGLGQVEDIDWDQPIVTGFHPTMTHPNGFLFPSRQAKTHVPVFKYKFLEEVKHYESRISKALDLGVIRTLEPHQSIKLYDSVNDNFNELCNVLEGNADSPNLKFYGSLDRAYRRLLGFSPETTTSKRIPETISAVEMSLASLRDPGFYRLCKKIVDHGWRFKMNLPGYKRDELSFDGIRIDYVHLDNLVTYFNTFESSLNHPRVLSLEENSRHQSPTAPLIVKARQLRLDHKAFVLQIGVSSEKTVKAIVRVFLGPRYDVHGNELELDESLQEFYELDRWIADLKQGNNKLERSSTDSIFYVAQTTLSDAFNRILSRALKTSDETLVRDLTSRKLRRGLPLRLLLPRGTKSGLHLRLLVCLHSVPAKLEEVHDTTFFEGLKLDGRPMGFPLDRAIENEKFSSLRNFMVKNIVVHHENTKNIDKD